MTETVYRPSRDSSPLCRHDVPLSSCLTGRKKTHTKTNKQENKQNKTNCLFFKGNQISPSCVQDVVGRAHQSHAEALDARCWFFEPFRFHQAEPSQVTLWSVSTVNRGIQNPPPPSPKERGREREICGQGDCQVFFLYLSIPLFSVPVNDPDLSIFCSRTPPIPHTTMYLLIPSLFVGTVLGEH